MQPAPRLFRPLSRVGVCARRWILLGLVLAMAGAGLRAQAQAPVPPAPAPRARTVSVGGGHFIVNGKPVQIIAGSMHYVRIPRPYWQRRLAMARAMGLNAVSVYAFWNVHEPHRGQWDFSGQYDITQFVRLAQQAGLYVILRPGPYICGEWSFGGYPAWLLKNPSLRVRTVDPDYLQAAQSYMNHLGRQLEPLLWTHGGPIIAVQVENEYGSFDRRGLAARPDSGQRYLEAVKRMVIEAGLGDAVLYTADGPGLWGGALPDLPEAIDVSPGAVESGFKQLLKWRPHSRLLYAAEYYPGWFDTWGKPHRQGAPIAEQIRDLAWVLGHGYSVNLYMFHGGTDWGFLNGANAQGSGYAPQTTSYDYSAPLDEAGHPTPAYDALRNLFQQYAPHHRLPPVPPPVPLITIAPFQLPLAASLWSRLPRAQARLSQSPLPFARFDLQAGYMLYRTQIHSASGRVQGTLDIGGARDYAVVYLNGRRVGTLDRRLQQHRLLLNASGPVAQLDILVEDTGRINYGAEFPTDRKGLIFPVRFNGSTLRGWENIPMPLEQVPALHWSKTPVDGPAFHRGSFTLEQSGDTFLDVHRLGKGLLWVNGHAIGRIWRIGPQQSDYVPGCWLHRGTNTVTVFDLYP